ncbi:hypothetical protein [Mycobacterium hubeiense]|nr:hypothetical protein [Mycobacterium sp. QGD 101]
MTALQDWLSIGPVNPRNVKNLVCGVLRGTREDDARRSDLPLIRPGIERC